MSAGGLRRAVGEFLYGMTAYEFEHQALELRRSQEALFLLLAFGDMLGVPVIPPFHALRLLPQVLPRLGPWKRSLLRERELGDDHEHHLHGL